MIDLRRVFGQDVPSRKICTVVARLDVGRYRVRDALGRVVDVDADRAWRAGQSVVVVSARIVDKAAGGSPEIIEV